MKIDVRYSLDIAISAALEAGRAIIAVHENDACTVEFKLDDSPRTYADNASYGVIMRFWEKVPHPVLSEGGAFLSL